MIEFVIYFIVSIVILFLFAAFMVIIGQVAARVWPNYITPWLDKHFGKSGW